MVSLSSVTCCKPATPLQCKGVSKFIWKNFGGIGLCASHYCDDSPAIERGIHPCASVIPRVTTAKGQLSGCWKWIVPGTWTKNRLKCFQATSDDSVRKKDNDSYGHVAVNRGSGNEPGRVPKRDWRPSNTKVNCVSRILSLDSSHPRRKRFFEKQSETPNHDTCFLL